MALFFSGKSQCSICGVVVNDYDAYVGTTHFIDDQTDPLWQFSDSIMHKDCFLAWPLRHNFVERYNATVGTVTWGNGTYHHMEANGNISVLMRDSEP